MKRVNDDIVLRNLDREDYEKGFLKILSQLTTVGNVSKEEFDQRLNDIQSAKPPFYKIFVLEDVKKGIIIGAATLLLELKFVHACGKVGHIEDVVVDKTYRGLNLGLILVKHLMDIAKEEKCYKIHLDCSEANVPFYEKCGFKKKELQMVWYDTQPANL